jgi:hypothetical protein
MKGRKIHLFFDGQSILNKILGFPISDLPYNLCWYPSAGFDFRHIVHFELDADDSKNKPAIYLMTDPAIELYSQNNVFPFHCDNTLYESADQSRKLIVKDCHPVYLKQELGFWPFNSENFENGLLHENFNDQYSGNVYFILAELSAFLNRRKVKIEIPIFYFTYENMDFLLNFLLPNGIQIHHLIHIKDGSGYGGSRYPMHFIYQFHRQLKIKQVISDRDLHDANVDLEFVEAQITEYSNFQRESEFFGRTNGVVSEEIYGDFQRIQAPLAGWDRTRCFFSSDSLDRYSNFEESSRNSLFRFKKIS